MVSLPSGPLHHRPFRPRGWRCPVGGWGEAGEGRGDAVTVPAHWGALWLTASLGGHLKEVAVSRERREAREMGAEGGLR